MAGAPVFFTRSTARASSSLNRAVASTRNNTTSALAEDRTWSIIRLLRSVEDSWMPGVSTNTICAPGTLRTPWMAVRVVCGRGATIASLVPNSAFSSVDFPALGRPRIETKPDLCFMSFASLLFCGLGDAHLVDTQVIGGQH